MNNLKKMLVTAATAAALVVGSASAASATNPSPQPPQPVSEWHTWLIDEVYVDSPEVDTDVSWPQTYLGAGQVAPMCGQWVQQDFYVGLPEEIAAVIADGILNAEEDWHLTDREKGGDWKIVYGGDCVEPEPEVTDPPVEEEVTDDAAEQPTLAATGVEQDVAGIGIIGAAAIAIITVGLIIFAVRRKV